MSDEKNEEAGKPEETELSEDQLEQAAGGAIIPIQTPLEEAVIPFQTPLEEQKPGIQQGSDPVKGD